MSCDGGSVDDLARAWQQDRVTHEAAHDGVEELVGHVRQQLILTRQRAAALLPPPRGKKKIINGRRVTKMVAENEGTS